MNYVLVMVTVIGGAALSKSDTPYHYITQVSETTPLTLSPKPLFSSHDNRREGNGRNDFGLKILEVGAGSTSTLKPLFANVENNVYGDQAIWYPVYSDVQYPGWVSLSQTPVLLSYGDLPEGYAPSAPPKGDPLGYSFSYQAGDHTRQESSDGRGNFFSSFSFIPPADSIGLQPYGKQSPPGTLPPITNHGVLPTERPQVVHIPSRRPAVRPTTSPPTYKPALRQFITQSESAKHFDIPTARPLIKSQGNFFENDDFTNGFNFESKKLHTTRVPQTAFTVNHALSTNIHYNNREPSSTTNPPSTGVRRVTILSSDSPSQPSTPRSYQALSRSLPLAFSSQRFSTESQASVSPSLAENRYPSPPSSYRLHSDDDLRSSTRRSTTESIAFRSGRRQTTPPDSSKSLSVIQKIPRKLQTENGTEDSVRRLARPRFIDDLTVLAYSSDNNPMNNSIIQIKSGRDKTVYKKNPGPVEPVALSEYLKNSSNPHAGIISKDGYMSRNKTYLGGIGLSSNIHY